MDEFDFLLGGSDPTDPLQLGEGLFEQVTGVNLPYRYTSRYGTLMDSYRERSRAQARRDLRNHMMQYEAGRVTAQATAILNSGAQGLSDEQRQIMQQFASGSVTRAGLQTLSMAGVNFGLDAGRAALSMEDALRFTPDPRTGFINMDADRRAKIAAYVATDMYRPGQGRSFAGGLSGQDAGTLMGIMGQRGQLFGAAQMNDEINQFLRTDPSVLPGGQHGRRMTGVDAERMDELRNLAIMRSAAEDPTLSDEELKNASSAYEEALNRAVGKRISQGLREKARAISSMQRHFRNVEGEDIAVEEAYAIVEEMLGPNAGTQIGRGGIMVQQLSQLSQATGMSMRQLQAARARGAQFADAMGLGSSNLGATLTMQSGNFIVAQQSEGVFNQPIFGIGDRDTELMEDMYLGSAFGASGVNRAQSALMRLQQIAPGELQDGRVKDIVTKLRAGQQLSDDEYDLLRRPSELIKEMQIAAPGLEASYAQSLIETADISKEHMFYDPETSMANRRNLQTSEAEQKMDKNILGVVGSAGTGFANPLDAKQQVTAVSAVIEEFRNATPERAKYIGRGTEGADRVVGIEMTKNALIAARRRGDISFDDSQLDEIARATYTQAQDAAAKTAQDMQRDSSAELILDMSNATAEKDRRSNLLNRAVARMQTQAADYAGETSLTGLMSLLEGADNSGEPVDFVQIGAAILSGASDEKQADILRANRDQLINQMRGLQEQQKRDLESGALTEEARARLQDDIAVAGTIIDHIDKLLRYDDPNEPGAGGKTDGKDAVTEYGPDGAEGGGVTMNNVTLIINDAEVGRNLSVRGKGSYGGRNAVPTSQVN